MLHFGWGVMAWRVLELNGAATLSTEAGGRPAPRRMLGEECGCKLSRHHG